MANPNPKTEHLRPFTPGDPRINRAGRAPGLTHSVKALARIRAKDAMAKLEELLECGEHKVELEAAKLILAYSGGTPIPARDEPEPVQDERQVDGELLKILQAPLSPETEDKEKSLILSVDADAQIG